MIKINSKVIRAGNLNFNMKGNPILNITDITTNKMYTRRVYNSNNTSYIFFNKKCYFLLDS